MLSGAGLSGACGPPGETGPQTSGRPNLLLVVVDTLRTDRVSAYGGERPTMPNLEALAARGTRFERAYSAAPWTMPAVASVLTGLPPTSHGVTDLVALPEAAPTLATELGAAGFRTGAVVSHALIGSRYGFERGFERFVEDQAQGHDHVSTAAVTLQAQDLLKELSGDGAQSFLLVHYFDPHYAYKRHPSVGFAPRRAGSLRGGEPIGKLRAHLHEFGDLERRFLLALYDEEVRHTDWGLGHLFDELEDAGLAESTFVVVTADHGEEFLDRGWLGHLRSLYDELVRVPLVVAGPGVRRDATVEATVSTVSLAPTALELLGVERPGFGAAPSLVGYLTGAGDEAEPLAFFEVSAKKVQGGAAPNLEGLVRGHHKLIRDRETGGLSLHDLRTDPGELSDLAGERPELLQELTELLDAHAARARERGLEAVPVELDPAELEALEGLGYGAGD